MTQFALKNGWRQAYELRRLVIGYTTSSYEELSTIFEYFDIRPVPSKMECQFHVLVLASILAFSVAHCPPYWTAYGDFCYRLFASPMTWEMAELKCMEFSTCEGNEIGHLASIPDAASNNYIVQIRRVLAQGDVIPRVWIGLNDRTAEGLFEWTSGMNVSYTNWERGQPNNAGGVENCVRLPGVNSMNMWDDANCLEQLPFVCQLPGFDPRRSQMMGPMMLEEYPME